MPVLMAYYTTTKVESEVMDCESSQIADYFGHYTHAGPLRCIKLSLYHMEALWPAVVLSQCSCHYTAHPLAGQTPPFLPCVAASSGSFLLANTCLQCSETGLMC